MSESGDITPVTPAYITDGATGTTIGGGATAIVGIGATVDGKAMPFGAVVNVYEDESQRRQRQLHPVRK